MANIKYVFFIILCFIISPSSDAKKRCKPLLEKLHNVQAMQRAGYSAQRGLSLRKREDKARDNWWQCEKGKGKKKTKGSKKVQKKSARYQVKSTQNNNKKIAAGSPFKTSNTIVIRSKYQGNKKRAWLAFYHQPTRCQRPKNLQVFAFCSENKLMQQADFEKKYQ